MKFSRWFYSAALLPLAVSSAELPAPATEVQIFRNSSAMIRHEVTPKGVSSFTVTGNFAPLEGTLWSSPNVKQIRKTLTEISRKEPIPFNDIISTWKNQRVTLRLACGNGKIELCKLTYTGNDRSLTAARRSGNNEKQAFFVHNRSFLSFI